MVYQENKMKDKIPFYNIVNMFFVGAVFSFGLVILLRNYIRVPAAHRLQFRQPATKESPLPNSKSS